MQKITPGDIRYADLSAKRFNKRFLGKPEYIVLPSSVEEVVEAVQEATDNGKRPVVRSGGHCLEGFVSDPAAQVLIDTSLMTHITYDAEMGAISVEAGATVGELYRRLFLSWGVLLPAGEHPGIGVGGHILGGAFGFLCREHGLAADYLYAVELVAVDEQGKAHTVIATREANDPNRELWWAHTGAGGGNFGIVTRYWLRAAAATGKEPPNKLLPQAPATITTFRVGWEWKDFTEDAFSRLLRNFGEWCYKNSAADVPSSKLFSILFLYHRNIGRIEIKGLTTAASDEAMRLVNEHLDAIAAPVGIEYSKQIDEYTWLQFALNPFPELFQPGMDSVPAKVKDSFFREPFTDKQVATAWEYLTAAVGVGGALGLATYGGKVNTLAPDATASPQRDSIMDVACNTGWMDPAAAETSLDWVRRFYAALFAGSGGVPVPGTQTDGAMINHPDTDLADPQFNRSGLPWSTFYYKENYPRLQQVKAKWDPLNIFNHALSIRVAE